MSITPTWSRFHSSPCDATAIVDIVVAGKKTITHNVRSEKDQHDQQDLDM
jgi:hypothetical protein